LGWFTFSFAPAAAFVHGGGTLNLVLFATAGEAARLAPTDARATHIREVLRMRVGDKLFVGLVNGPRGMATIAADGTEGLRLEIKWEEHTEPPRPFWALVGLPRPQTARDLLREAATFGIAGLYFFQADKGEPSYAQSTLWTSDEWQKRMREGAAQACATTVPEVAHFPSLAACLKSLDAGTGGGTGGEGGREWDGDADAVGVEDAVGLGDVVAVGGRDGSPSRPRTPRRGVPTLNKDLNKDASRLALDVYEASAPLSALAPTSGSVVLALGAERGWSAEERNLLRAAGFALAHLGPRVLRTETALVAGLSVLLSKRNEF